MAVKGYKNVDAMNPRGGYQKPSTIIAPIPNHRDGHYVRPNRVALKYPDFKKDVDLDAHVRMFNSTIKANAKTFEKYIINAFRYMLRDTSSNWCHNYMSQFFNYSFLEFIHPFCKCH
jgi:hypothetical protein